MAVSHLGFDWRPWGIAAAAALVLSALFWLPLVRHFTRGITQISRTTGEIAQSRLKARVPARRHDELGDLGESINHMGALLEGLLHGQKRFLGDNAHELRSPIARLQLALAILEEQVGSAHQEDVAAATQEVRQLAELVDRLLTFSKAELGHAGPRLQAVCCRTVAQHAVEQEKVPPHSIQMRVPNGLSVLADPDLLHRALANLVRNALNHANHAGPITITADRQGSNVLLVVADAGPGVPETDLPLIFEPFYRVDASRAPRTGGVGLGLAIVKSCIESCGGLVTAQNRKPSGLEVTITLRGI